LLRFKAFSMASFGDRLAVGRVPVQPEREGVLDQPGDEARGLARRQPFLGLARELRLAQLDREHEAQSFPGIFGGQPHAARQQVADVAELAQRLDQTGAQSVDVGAALRRRDQVDVAFRDQLAFRHPGQRPGGLRVLATELADERSLGNPFLIGQGLGQVVGQSVFIVPFDLFVLFPVVERDRQPRAEDRLGTQQVLEAQP
jgi:hypothetical protein